MLVVVGTSNATNLTDGLDGLASGCMVFTAVTYGIFAYVAGNVNFADYLKISAAISAPVSTTVASPVAAVSTTVSAITAFTSEILPSAAVILRRNIFCGEAHC